MSRTRFPEWKYGLGSVCYAEPSVGESIHSKKQDRKKLVEEDRRQIQQWTLTSPTWCSPREHERIITAPKGKLESWVYFVSVWIQSKTFRCLERCEGFITFVCDWFWCFLRRLFFISHKLSVFRCRSNCLRDAPFYLRNFHVLYTTKTKTFAINFNFTVGDKVDKLYNEKHLIS